MIKKILFLYIISHAICFADKSLFEWQKIINAQYIFKISNGQDITIAVVDTGIDLKNLYFKSKVWENLNEIADDGIDNDLNGYIDDIQGWDFGDSDNLPQDEHGHGTEVASIILQLVPNCKIIPIKINPGGSGNFYTESLSDAVYYAAKNGADIINLSLVVDQEDEMLENAINQAYDLGVVIIGAAGNSGEQIAYPAFLDYIISVGSLHTEDTIASWFSAQGPELDIVAPGVLIDVISLDNTATTESGTSMSAPMISGTAAALLAQNSYLKPDTIKWLLTDSAKDLGDPGHDNVYGHGALDGKQLFYEITPKILLPDKPFYSFSHDELIEINYFLPPFDTRTDIYIGFIDSQNKGYWLDFHGNWHNLEFNPLKSFTQVELFGKSIKGTLFGDNAIFPLFDPYNLAPGLYKWIIIVTDMSGKMLHPEYWTNMLVF